MSTTVTGKTRPVRESSVPHGDDPGRKSLRARKEFRLAGVFIGLGMGQEDLENPRITIVHGNLPETLLILHRSFKTRKTSIVFCRIGLSPANLRKNRKKTPAEGRSHGQEERCAEKHEGFLVRIVGSNKETHDPEGPIGDHLW